MDAVRQSLRGKRGDRGLEDRRTPGGTSPTRRSPGTHRRRPSSATARYSVNESTPRRRKAASRCRSTDSSWATVRRHRSASRRPATTPTCGSARERSQTAAAEVQAVELNRRRHRGWRPGPTPASAASSTCPTAGAPTTATLPAAPDKSTVRGSCRCSNGQSTSPIGTRRWRRGAARSSASRLGEPASGGNHTRCAAGPRPASACSTVSINERCRTAVRHRRRHRVGARGGRRREELGDNRFDPLGVGAEVACSHPRRTRSGTGSRRRRPSSGRPPPAASAGDRHRPHRAPPGTRWPRTSSGRSGRTGGFPVRAACPRRGAGWPAAGACPATGPAVRSPRTTRRSRDAG